MNLPEYVLVRSRIENVKDIELQMFLKSLYLLGAMVSEIVGKIYPSENYLHPPYGPIGNDASSTLYEQKTLVAFFTIKTAKKKGQKYEPPPRTIALPIEYEPWAKELYDYFKKAGNEFVFPFTRQEAYNRTKNAETFKGLKYTVEYTIPPHKKDFGIDLLRQVRANELTLKYGFNAEDLDAYGVGILSMRRVHRQTVVSFTSEHNAQPWERYLLKLCK